jgi:hypothetical protein
VGDAILVDRILQGAGNMLLAKDVREALRTIFAGEDRVAHMRTLSVPRIAANRKTVKTYR